MKALTAVTAYEKFIKERDHGLERVLAKYSKAISDIVAVLKVRAQEVAGHMVTTSQHRDQLKRARQQFHDALAPYFDMGISRATALMQEMRRTTYLISAAGASQAISATLQKEHTLKISRDDLRQVLKDETHAGGPVELRMELGFGRLLRAAVDAFQLSQVMGSTALETIERVGRSFPRTEKTSHRRRVMAKLQEAERKKDDPEIAISELGIEQDDWDAAVEDYLSDQLIVSRAPYDRIFQEDSETPEYFQRAVWEVEQDLTNDFVDQVRDGENEAANQAGINDFSWIAIVDKKTDECCLLRDGLTISEIEARLAAGDDMGGCDATSCPAHPFCRCRLAPMTKNIPDEQPTDFGSFDGFLRDQANKI